AAVVMFMSVPAQAQIEEIVVTATKRAESLQDVGVAVSAFSGDDIRSGNVVTPRDLFQKIPNVAVQSNSTAGQLQLAIRGISFATFSPIGVQPAIVFQDEVAMSSPQAAGLFIFDSERIEVLRGPQNILYGRNTTAGAVNFISRKPEVGGGTSGYADLTAGNFGVVDFNGAIGGELGDNSAYRLAVQSLNNDGYWDNLNIPGDKMGERNQHLFRAQVAVEPSDDVSWLINIHGGTSKGGQRPIKAHGLFMAGDPGGATCDDLDIDDHTSTCVGLFDTITNPNTDETYSELQNDKDDITAFGGSVRLDWDFDNFSLMSLTAFEQNDYDHWEENDGLEDVPFVLFRQKADTEQWSQEFRLTSDADAELRWIAGAYLLTEDVMFRTSVPILLLFAENGRVNQDTDMFSAFGQVEYDVSDSLTFTAGLRYVNEEKSGNAIAQFSDFALDVNGTLDPENGDLFLYENLEQFRAGPTAGGTFGESWDQWGWQLGLEYSADSGTLWYGHITRGEKGGQFTDAPDAIIQGTFSTPVEPEEVVAFEAGFKATWADDTVQTNVAVFYNDYTNQHAQITIPVPGGVASTVVNAAESEIMGLEAEMIWAPGNGWYLDAALGLLDTEITKDSVSDLTGGAVAIEEGRKLTNAPETTFNFGITKDFELSGGNTVTANLNGRYVSEREYNLVDTADVRDFTTDPSFLLLNGYLDYRFGGDQQYRLSVWGKNLTDELYFNHIQEFGIGSTIGYMSNPRQYGVTFGVDF
nr:TonB-dependent receptor [Acidimicrobiales bacterium]